MRKAVNLELDKEKVINAFNEQIIEWKQPILLDNQVLPIFNTSIFPKWLKEFVDGVAEVTQTPKDAAAMACLSILSTILGGRFVIKARKDWIEQLNLYTVMAMDPANRKSAVFGFFQKPLTTFEKDERERLTALIVEEQAERSAILKKITDLERRYGKTENADEAKAILQEVKELSKEVDETVKPPIKIPRFFTSDATPEKIAALMNDNNESFAILSSEGAEVFQMMAGRYSDKINIDVYLKAYSGDNITIDRIGEGRSISLENPTLTIGMFVQPSVIQELPSYFLNRGLNQRFLYFLPKSFIGRRKIIPNDIPETVIKTFNTNIRKLIKLKFPTNKNNVETNSIALVFDDEAKHYLAKIQTEVELMLLNQDMNEGFKGWLGKLVGQIIRISGLLHLADNVQSVDSDIPKIITKDILMKADSLRDYFIQHAEKALGIIGENQSFEDVKYLLKKITSKKFDGREKIDSQEIWQLVKKRFKRSEKYNDVLLTLEEMNYIKVLKDGRKHIIYVNPYLSKNSPNSPNDSKMKGQQVLKLGNEETLEVPIFPSSKANQNK